MKIGKLKSLLLVMLLIAHGLTLSQGFTAPFNQGPRIIEGDKILCGVCREQLGYCNPMGCQETSIGHHHLTGLDWQVIPPIYIDSMIFETIQGRECSKLADSYLNQIYYRDSLLEEGAKLIDLQSGVIESQNQIIEDWPKEVRANAEICSQQKVKLKQKIRRLWRLAFIESGVIVVLVILI